MQCKDIPDLPILQFLKLLEERKILSVWLHPNGRLESCHLSAAIRHENFACSVVNAMPQFVIGKPKLVLAKMGRLMERDLVFGCVCGCRGDFELTDKGRTFLVQQTAVEA